MSIYEMWGTEAILETGGVWIDYGKEAGKFLIARAGGANTKFAKVLEAKMRPHRRLLEGKGKQKKLDNDIATKVLMEAFIEGCLLEWEGVTDRDGKELPLTKANAVQLFTDLPDLFNDLREQASSMATFQQEEMEDDAGN